MWFVYLILIFSFCFTESSKEQFAYTNIAEELVKLFKKQIEHDKREMIFEVLAPLAENGENWIFSFPYTNFYSFRYIEFGIVVSFSGTKCRVTGCCVQKPPQLILLMIFLYQVNRS